jgi:hypothetical protein
MTTRPPNAVSQVDPSIIGDIKRASRSANVDFSYLVATAAQESGFQPNAQASTSSAAGLYQFLDTTWLQAVKQYGAKYGLSAQAAQISDDGRYTVADPSARQQILDLRKDPRVAADLAAEFAKQNKDAVEKALGRPASSTDLYLAHFLGAHGATQFVQKIESDGSAKAADLLPQAAAANHSVFYDSATGEAKTVAQIYRSFAAKIEANISKYADATGDDGATAAEAVLLRSPLDTPTQNSPTLLSQMSVLALAAMKLIGAARAPEEQAAADPTEKQRRQMDTSV